MSQRGEVRATGSRARLVGFTVICLAAVVLCVGAIVRARAEDQERVRSSGTVPVQSTPAAPAVDGPALLFSNTSLGDRFGALAAVPADAPETPRTLFDLDCERVHYRAGRGICLHADRGFISTYEAIVFDDRGTPLHTISLAGAPSRTKIAPSGNIGAVTVFVTGHSYAQGGFSTQTTLIDLASGTTLADLETDFTVLRDGARWREVDFNFWGVTFVDDERFYATLASGGETYLIAGDIPTREAHVVRSGVECPSLSPDGTRLAFKERNSGGLGPITWHFSVLDLASGETTALAETRDIDDQAEWLDDETVLYGLPRDGGTAEIDTWAVRADGTGTPWLVLESAVSTTVVEGPQP